MIKKLSYIFGSKTHAQEILFLLHDAKEVVRQGFYAEELPKIEKFCRDFNLIIVKSKFKVLLADAEAYSNKGIRVPEDDIREGMYFVYISKSEQKACLASYYELISNDRDLGILLGFPCCCVDFFCQKFTVNKQNLELPSTNPFTNLSKRAQDLVILSHFPCRSDCQDSINLAKRYLDVLMKVDSRRVEELLKALKDSAN
ncbi:hypothetical protein J4421_05745 [Candidatus Woesearchaeota archaeon]|nr:hypothetical protein [Candidatus Woesearchaeota archaeon]